MPHAVNKRLLLHIMELLKLFSPRDKRSEMSRWIYMSGWTKYYFNRILLLLLFALSKTPKNCNFSVRRRSRVRVHLHSNDRLFKFLKRRHDYNILRLDNIIFEVKYYIISFCACTLFCQKRSRSTDNFENETRPFSSD